jgi:hypothetical protein
MASNERRHEHAGKHETVHSIGSPFGKANIPDEEPKGGDRRHCHERSVDSGVRDPENGSLNPGSGSEAASNSHTFTTFYGRHRVSFHLFIWLLSTG